jgi:hypothetical protein
MNQNLLVGIGLGGVASGRELKSTKGMASLLHDYTHGINWTH